MRSAISAGALALALGGGIPMIAGVPADSARQPDCGSGGGLLGGLTGGICQVVDTATDVVDGLTGDALDPVTDGLDGTAETLNDTAGGGSEERPEPKATASAGPGAAEGSGGEPAEEKGLLPKVLGDTCLPLVASASCDDSGSAPPPEQEGRPDSSSESGSTRTGKAEKEERKEEEKEAVPPSPAASHRPEPRTHTTEVSDPVLPEPPVIDIESPRLDPLLPGPLIQEFQQRLPSRQTVTPTRRSDPLGTILTTALLAAAILAIRMMYGKRAAEKSIPFEPLRAGRHRVA
ncbi:hypothetical protein [Planomonospora venezuelensis]|uniref:Uncharacterized protein n=1 Tax=Planomonospora venezuelensis TaxID=1999 RepID=A0A841D796_PLAVE|nr:hypothetical protein [Planomonospora venezuelensis]MBB5963306.1 hypothetical protein [Planomonospora venezuelensis]GIN02711.1 hypothetical protein Pve01_43690 [Planomonospora venezuelensis]